MPISDEDIKRLCVSKGNRTPSDADVYAFRTFMLAADCVDAETVEEADEKIMATMTMVCDSDSPFADHDHFFSTIQARHRER